MPTSEQRNNRKAELKDQFWQAYEMYYTVNLTYAQIGRCFGLSREGAHYRVREEAKRRKIKRKLNLLEKSDEQQR